MKNVSNSSFPKTASLADFQNLEIKNAERIKGGGEIIIIEDLSGH
ncbi:MAG: hypothetical protein AAFZ15_32430 [Bacteroidota bacterium]